MEWRSRDGLVRVETASARAARLEWPRVCHGRATYAWAMTGGLVVKHGGAVLAVEGTWTLLSLPSPHNLFMPSSPLLSSLQALPKLMG